MFEIHDDDGFWEKLPLDNGFGGQTNQQGSLDLKDNGFQSSKPIHFNSAFLNTEEQRVPSIIPEPSNYMQTHRPQLAPIHNVIKCNRPVDQTSISIPVSQNDIPCNRSLLQVQEDLPREPFRTGSSRLATTNTTTTTADQTPLRNKLSHKSGSKRKFPGPAGLLPESFPSESCMIQSDSPVIEKEEADSKAFTSSQSSSSCDPFSSIQWQSLVSDVGPDANSVLNRFSIRSMLLKASKRVLPKGKMPLVLAHVESVDFHGCDGTAVLRDPSGKVNGALHNDLVKDPSTAIKSGCVIVLRQTSVISPTPRTHYLNITPANIVAIYSQHKDSSKVQKSPWSPIVPLGDSSILLPPLSQIIQDSDNELKSAVNNTTTAQQRFATSTRQSPELTNLSKISLFGSVTSSPPTSVPHRFPASPANTPVHNRFKSPLPLHAAALSSHPSFSNQRYPTKYSNSFTGSVQTNSVSSQSQFPSAYASGANISHRTSNQSSRQLSTTNSKTSSSINYQQYNAATLPSAVMKMRSPTRISGQTNSLYQDDFLGDDSDLLFLCDDSNSACSNNVTMSNQSFNQSAISRNKNSDGTFSTHSQTSLSNNHNGLYNSRNNEIEALLSANSVAQTNCSETDKSSTSIQFEILDRNKVRNLQKAWSADSGLEGNADIGLRDGINRMSSSSGRDSRVQLGVSEPPHEPTTAVAQAPNFDTWDDDLDDELLSQL